MDRPLRYEAENPRANALPSLGRAAVALPPRGVAALVAELGASGSTVYLLIVDAREGERGTGSPLRTLLKPKPGPQADGQGAPETSERCVSPVDRLSVQQRAVLQLIAAGSTTREVAQSLVLSERTVERHIANLYAKIGVRNRAEATAYAAKQGLIQ